MKSLHEQKLGQQWNKELRHRIAGATKALAADAGLHDAHVEIKEARAMVRLAGRGKRAGSLRRALRAVAEPMSFARDGQALLATAKQLEAPGRLIASLELQQTKRMRQFASRRAGLREVLRHLSEAESPRVTKKDACRGLIRAESRARAAMKLASKGTSDGAFHELRKRCKDLEFQYDLLVKLVPRAKRNGKVARDIGRALGEANDLVGLQEWSVNKVGKGKREWLLSARELQAEGLRLAKRLLD